MTVFDFMNSLNIDGQIFVGYIGFVVVVTIAGGFMIRHYIKKEAG